MMRSTDIEVLSDKFVFVTMANAHFARSTSNNTYIKEKMGSNRTIPPPPAKSV